MANVKDVRQHSQKVTMMLGNDGDVKERTIQFDMNAFAELETKYGTIDDAMKQLMSGRIKDIRTILWAGLIHGEVVEFDEDSGEPIKYGITPYLVGSWIKGPNMLQEVSKKLSDAMAFDMPDVKNLPEDVKAELAARGIELPDDANEEQAKNA